MELITWYNSLRGKRLEVVGVLSRAQYFQAPASQANDLVMIKAVLTLEADKPSSKSVKLDGRTDG